MRMISDRCCQYEILPEVSDQSTHGAVEAPRQGEIGFGPDAKAEALAYLSVHLAIPGLGSETLRKLRAGAGAPGWVIINWSKLMKDRRRF
jgi:hypothetical protein